MTNYNTVVLISVNEINARKICERVEGEFIEDFDNHYEFRQINPEHYAVYSISDFIDLVNNQELDVLTEYFITFVNTKEL